MRNADMRKILFILLLALCAVCVGAQHRRFSPQQFQAEMEKFITSEAKLTRKEAARFFPVYSEMCRKKRVLFDEMKRCRKTKPATDAECRKIIQKIDGLDIRIKELERQYHGKFLKILPAGKVYDVLKAEARFHRQAFKRMNGRNSKKKKK